MKLALAWAVVVVPVLVITALAVQDMGWRETVIEVAFVSGIVISCVVWAFAAAYIQENS